MEWLAFNFIDLLDILLFGVLLYYLFLALRRGGNSTLLVGIITFVLMWGLFFILIFIGLQSVFLNGVTLDMNQFKEMAMTTDLGTDVEVMAALETLANLNYAEIIGCFLI